MTKKFTYPSSLRFETKRLRTLFKMLDSPIYKSFLKAPSSSVSKKDDQLRFRGVKIFFITYGIFFLRRKLTKIHKEEFILMLQNFKKLFFPTISSDDRWICTLAKKISSSLLRIFAKIWLWKKFEFFCGEKKVVLLISPSWKSNLSVIHLAAGKNFKVFLFPHQMSYERERCH